MNAINQLKNGETSGPEKITITLVKDTSEFFAHPPMLIYNSSLVNDVFPDIWKLARVTQICKSGPKTDVSSYRPISVISVFSRMLGTVTHNQLFDFVKIIKSNQAAFLKLCSTIT